MMRWEICRKNIFYDPRMKDIIFQLDKISFCFCIVRVHLLSIHLHIRWICFMLGWHPLKMGYFDNLGSRFLNKYKKFLKIEKKYKYVILLAD
jgi:hypothetical protein